MIVQGQFRNVNDELITVIFTKDDGNDTTVNIGTNIKFAMEPVTIETTNDDLFNTIIRKSAKIGLLTTEYVGDFFFAKNARDILVEIKKGNTWLFYGYVDPCSFNQPYTTPLDDFEVNCIDVLSTLQYYNYKNAKVGTYDAIKAAAKNVTFREIIDTMFDGIDVTLIYDRSRGIDSSRTNTIFEDLTLSELNIVGDDYDEIWTYQETLDEILKYLNLHIIQEGKKCYIFDWQSIEDKITGWYDLSSDSTTLLTPMTIRIVSDDHTDRSTNITIDDVYSQIGVQCDLNEQSELIQSPLNKDSLNSLWKGKQLYMTEYISEGSGDHSNSAFNNIVDGLSDPYEDCKTVDWFMQVMTNKYWKLYHTPNHVVEELAEQQNGEYINQWKIPKYLRENSCVPSLIRMGKVEHKGGPVLDNSPISKVDMSDYLIISVNGNETSDENDHLPADATLEAHAPIMEYIGNNSGGCFSPLDDETINYLVFSGRMLLQPIQYESSTDYANRNNNFEAIRNGHARKTEGSEALVPDYLENPIIPIIGRRNIIKSDNNTEGRYYTRKFYTQTKVTDKPNTYLTSGQPSLQPWTQDKSAHGYEFNYSATGNGEDKYSKLPILECELIIGNKRLVETDIDEYGNSTFQWYELGHEPTRVIDGQTYTLTTFSLGVNPKIGDYIIGDEFPIQNTIDYTMCVDAEGTAIPIRKSDNISGQVHFKILGLINSLWDDITRRHPSFWRHTRWTTNSRFVLAHTENVIIKDFECKIYSNNAGNENFENNEVVYKSNMTDSFIQVKDNVNFKIITQLSTQDCLNMGVKQTVNLNAVVNTTTNLPLGNLYDARTNETDKAEKHYINQYYLRYSEPRIILETRLHNGTKTKWNNVFHSTALDKDFIMMNSQLDLRANEITLKLRQI